jgi:2-isopropylmalate synthase
MANHAPVIEAVVDETFREGIERCPFLLSLNEKFTLLDAMVAAGLRQFTVNSADDPAFALRFLSAKLESNAYPADARLVMLVSLNAWEHCLEHIKTFPRAFVDDIIFMFGMIEYKSEQRTFERAFDAFARVGARLTRFSIINNFTHGVTDDKYADIRQQIERCVEVGIREGRVNDTLGTLLPDTTETLCARLVKDFPQVAFYLHAHNDLDIAVANVLASLRGGFRMVEGTLAGFANRSGLPPHEVIDKLTKLHGIEVRNTALDSDKLVAAARLAEQLFMVIPNIYRSVSGLFVDRQTVTILNMPDYLGIAGAREYFLSFASLEAVTIKETLRREGFDQKLVEDPEFLARVSKAVEQRMHDITEQRRTEYKALMKQIYAFHTGLTKGDMITIAESCASRGR